LLGCIPQRPFSMDARPQLLPLVRWTGSRQPSQLINAASRGTRSLRRTCAAFPLRPALGVIASARMLKRHRRRVRSCLLHGGPRQPSGKTGLAMGATGRGRSWRWWIRTPCRRSLEAIHRSGGPVPVVGDRCALPFAYGPPGWRWLGLAPSGGLCQPGSATEPAGQPSTPALSVASRTCTPRLGDDLTAAQCQAGIR